MYRVPLDEKWALMRIRRFQNKSEFWIDEVPDRDVPNRNAVKNWAVKFYKSTETHGNQPGDFEGGVIPGLEEFRYSLDWEPTPETELIEMKRNGKGGSKLRGESFVGTHDPRLSDYVEIDTEVPWTPTEIEAMFDGEPVPDKIHYSHDPPEMSATKARGEYRKMIDMAEDVGFKKAMEALHEFMEDCDHDHVITMERGYGDVATCEDCGKNWDRMDFDHDRENNELTVVGSA